MIIGGVSVVDAADGEIVVSRFGSPGDTIYNFWNGTFRESFAFTVSSNGTVITGTLTPTNGNVDMTALFSDGLSVVDTSPPATITLTAGTDAVPQMNYVYVPKTTKVLTVSTSGWPATEHIRVATVYLRSAATTQTEDALKVHNWNDHIQSTDGQGHLSHIGQKLRKFEAQWESGCELTAVLRTVPNPDELYVTVTGGYVFQMHPQTIKSFDTEVSDYIHVWNHFTTPFLSIQDIATQTTDSTGASLTNKHYSVVIWGSAASANEPAHLFMNLPSGSYNSASLALADPNNYAIYIIPPEFSGTGFLIARLVLSFGGGTSTMTVTANEDLRGKIPNTSAGGGSIGGAGATTYLALTDSPLTFTGDSLKAVRVNAGETALEHTTTLNLDTINEWTTSAGVTIEGMTIDSGALYNNGVSGYPVNFRADSELYLTYTAYNDSWWNGITPLFQRFGGTYAAPAAAPTDAEMFQIIGSIYDGTATGTIDGAVATDDVPGQLKFETRDPGTGAAVWSAMTFNSTDGLDVDGSITSNSTVTGQSTIGYGLVVNNLSSALAIADTAINTTTYTALTVDASNDSIQLMSNALGKVGFFGAAPSVQSTGWTITNHVATKVLDANATTVDEICDVLGELITELKLKGILGG
jgi:hypothetical protein